MNILIANYEYPPLGGGAGVCSRYHAEGLVALGHRVSVVTAWFEGEEPKYESGNLTIYKVFSKRKFVHKSNPWEMLSWSNHAKRFFDMTLKDDKWDICLTNFAIPGGFFANHLLKKYGIPFIILSHGQDIPWFFPRQLGLYHALFYLTIRCLLKASIKNIMLTAEMKASADKLLPQSIRNKNIVIPNGCDIYRFTGNIEEKSKEFTILFTGRLRPQKDPFTFLKAIRILAERKIPFTALILGDGPMRRSLEKYIKRNHLEKRVRIAGWVDKEQMLSAYRSASLLVSTSRDEGMSIALLESISTGLYVLATPASGNREMISDHINGKIIPFGRADLLADEICSFHETKFQQKYRVPEEFLQNFRRKYDWQEVVNMFDSMLKNTLE